MLEGMDGDLDHGGVRSDKGDAAEGAPYGYNYIFYIKAEERGTGGRRGPVKKRSKGREPLAIPPWTGPSQHVALCALPRRRNALHGQVYMLLKHAVLMDF
jgi:hypothetical protein